MSTTYPGFASTWAQYETWKAVLSFLDKNKVYDEWKTEFNKTTRFMEPGLKNEVVLSMMHHAILSLNKIRKSVPDWVFKIFFFEVCKFIIPVRVSAHGETIVDADDKAQLAVPWFFPTVQLDKLKWVDTSMVESAVYAGRDSKKRSLPEPARKKRKDNGCEAIGTEEVMTTCVKSEEGCQNRDKVWLDDVAAFIVAVLQDFADITTRELPSTDVVKQAVGYVVNLAYTFCFAKSATVNGKVCKKWSEMRIELKRILYSTLRAAKLTIAPADSSRLLLEVATYLIMLKILLKFSFFHFCKPKRTDNKQ